MNSENSKTSDPHKLLLNYSDKINLKRSDKYLALLEQNGYCNFTFNVCFYKIFFSIEKKLHTLKERVQGLTVGES